ncbi:hypothetical protein Zmor_023713 [Zophobas morio]|uniref:Pickpocket protein 28 n=1 Tax=Zophobas morio TaxID=2755281 RepID=A0AA38I3V6_9CUCU|nr:hypothetical protein Zmor_023713 [Zophobas morio]
MKKNFLKNMHIQFRDYCNHTSVHGFQYFGEKNRHIVERIWWLIVFVICLAACVISIYAVYKKWEESPVIVNFGNTRTPIYTIPFPAVTICPEAKSDRRIFNFTEVVYKMVDGIPLNLSEKVRFEYMSLICNQYPELNYTNNGTFSEEFYDVLKAVTPKFQILGCSFFEDVNDRCEFYVPVITEEGICYSFNMLDGQEIYRNTVLPLKDYYQRPGFVYENSSIWSLQDGYSENAGLYAYPIRAFSAGAKSGLTLNILTPSEDLDYTCKDALQGYKVMLHTPMTIPRPSKKYFRVPLDQSVMGAIEPVMITTSSRVKTYNYERRKCFLSNERQLRYFKNYTASNCNLECLTNYTLDVCGCVNFYMPRENGTKICGTGQVECMKSRESRLRKFYLTTKIENPGYLKEFDCNCLPLCTDLTYEVAISQINYEWKKRAFAQRRLPGVRVNSHVSALTLFFKSDGFITSERNELYGPIDFISNFGGLLGLFTGFSVLSLMEFFYFLSIRIICNVRLFGQWAGVEKE